MTTAATMTIGGDPTETRFELKSLGGIQETKQVTKNGIRLGIVEGYLATWDLDEGNDRFVRGAFVKSLQEHRERGDRQIRLRDHHGRTIGGFPIDSVKEDDRGLWGRGEINLEVQQGAEAYAMARAGHLTDFSIGYTPTTFRFEGKDGEIRVIEEAIVWEGSIVDEPMNRAANITAVKSHTAAGLPIADATTPWTGKDEGLEVVQDGKVIPRRVLAVALDVIDGMKEADRDDVIGLERIFAAMGQDSPFPAELRGFIGVDEAQKMDRRDLERALTRGMVFSRAAAKVAVARLQDLANPTTAIADLDQTQAKSLLEEIRSIVAGRKTD